MARLGTVAAPGWLLWRAGRVGVVESPRRGTGKLGAQAEVLKNFPRRSLVRDGREEA